jgi:hypothetical protein
VETDLRSPQPTENPTTGPGSEESSLTAPSEVRGKKPEKKSDRRGTPLEIIKNQ